MEKIIIVFVNIYIKHFVQQSYEIWKLTFNQTNVNM